MFLLLPLAQQELIVFLKQTKQFVHSISDALALNFDESEPMPDLTTTQEQVLAKAFWVLAYMFVGHSERQSKIYEIQPKKRNKYSRSNLIQGLDQIRNDFAHKLYLIEPQDYMTFFQVLNQDLAKLNITEIEATPSLVFNFNLGETLNFTTKHCGRVLNKAAYVPLFVYWQKQFNELYQSALIKKDLPAVLHEETNRFISILPLFQQQPNYAAVATTSLEIILGQLALRISQDLFPRDMQTERQSREHLLPPDQLLFDIQQIRNELVHDWPVQTMPYNKHHLIQVGFYLREITTLLIMASSPPLTERQQETHAEIGYQFFKRTSQHKKNIPEATIQQPLTELMNIKPLSMDEKPPAHPKKLKKHQKQRGIFQLAFALINEGTHLATSNNDATIPNVIATAKDESSDYSAIQSAPTSAT